MGMGEPNGKKDDNIFPIKEKNTGATGSPSTTALDNVNQVQYPGPQIGVAVRTPKPRITIRSNDDLLMHPSKRVDLGNVDLRENTIRIWERHLRTLMPIKVGASASNERRIDMHDMPTPERSPPSPIRMPTTPLSKGKSKRIPRPSPASQPAKTRQYVSDDDDDDDENNGSGTPMISRLWEYNLYRRLGTDSGASTSYQVQSPPRTPARRHHSPPSDDVVYNRVQMLPRIAPHAEDLTPEATLHRLTLRVFEQLAEERAEHDRRASAKRLKTQPKYEIDQ